MIRLRKLEISGFRGARFAVSLDFTTQHRSLAVFGDNGTGKSTITDAIEWFLTGRVDHLWREDCKVHALRNVKLGPTEDAIVSIEFSDKNLSGNTNIKPNLTLVEGNASAELQQYREDAKSERHHLRSAQLTQFVNKTKSEKRDEVAGIIGYEEILAFRSVIQSTLNTLSREQTYVAAKGIVDTKSAKLLELANKTIFSRVDLHDHVNEILKPYALGLPVKDSETYETAVTKLKQQVGDQDKAEKKAKFTTIKARCDDLSGAVKHAQQSQANFVRDYEVLIRDRKKIHELNLEEFLRRGKQIVDAGLPDEGKCPLCEQPVDEEKLRVELHARISELEKNKEELDALRTARDEHLTDLDGVQSACIALVQQAASLGLPEDSAATIEEFRGITSRHAQEIRDGFREYKAIRISDERREKEVSLLEHLSQLSASAEQSAKSLELTNAEEAIVEIAMRLGELRTSFDEYENNLRIKQAYEKQIVSLSTVFEEFIKVQNTALQQALDILSADISKFYQILHPAETVEGVRLRIVGEDGVEFEYSFHGNRTYPPMKYLSESHLNSLGIALFLASVKQFNKRSRYFVLDDAITSFDDAHRRRLARLLKDEFGDWQVILLTHQAIWFELLKRELGSAGWLFRELTWDDENGMQLAQSPKDFRALVKVKQQAGMISANDVRILTERSLKEIAIEIEAKVAYRGNDRNENRMVGELLSSIRSTVNKKCPALKNHKIFGQLEASNLVGTIGSHDRKVSISEGDVKVALEDLDELDGLLRCGKCGTLVAVERYVAPDRKITCRCGAKELPWTE